MKISANYDAEMNADDFEISDMAQLVLECKDADLETGSEKGDDGIGWYEGFGGGFDSRPYHRVWADGRLGPFLVASDDLNIEVEVEVEVEGVTASVTFYEADRELVGPGICQIFLDYSWEGEREVDDGGYDD